MKISFAVGLALLACGGAPTHVEVPAAGGKTAAAASPSACERREQAQKLSQEGDALAKVDLDGAIGRYGRALELDPTNYEVMWKLSGAYQTKQDWTGVVAALQRSKEVVPTFASFAHREGAARLELGRAGNREQLLAAREPLERCVASDPNVADCHFLLGDLEEWSDHDQAAAERFTRAIERDPRRAEYYLRLAQLYRAYLQYEASDAVLREGVRYVPRGPETDGHLCQMYFMLARLAKARKDEKTELAALEYAESLVDAAPPPLLFEIGGSLALYPSHKARAFKLLARFGKQVCVGSQAAQYEDACQTTAYLLAGLAK